MVASQIVRVRKTLGYSLILVGLMSGTSIAAAIVDLHEPQPLGVIFTNTAGDQATFSLGNGRALLIPVSSSSKKAGSDVRDLLLKRTQAALKAQSVRIDQPKRNLKW